MSNNRHTGQTGFTLLEVLVAIVIISIGLLGLISLQSASLKNTTVAAAQSQATIAAQSMVARMRANMAGIETYAGLSTDTVSTSANCLSTNCTPREIAKHGVAAWGEQLAQSLPDPTGSIENLGSAGPPYEFRLTISWQTHTGYQYNASVSGQAGRCSEDGVHCLTTRVVL